MSVYVIVYHNDNAEPIDSVVYKSWEKAIRRLYEIRDRVNAKGDDVHCLFKQSPCVVNEEHGIVYRKLYTFRYKGGEKYFTLKTIASIYERELDEEE